MRKDLLEILRCPNGRGKRFEVFARALRREGRTLTDVEDGKILADDVETGYVVDADAGQLYPITDFVLSMLSDADADPAAEIPLLRKLLVGTPAPHAAAIEARLARLQALSPSEVGDWNREEMRYYDRDVETPEKRAAFLETIRRDPLWNIYLERKSQLIDNIGVTPVRRVLEIGGGNSRTVSWIYPPREHRYSYVGTDISLQRLVLAKQVLPDGDFVQCSALNLPFRSNAFDLAIAFGVLHHLPDPVRGLRESFDKLRPSGEMLITEPIEKPGRLIPSSGSIKHLAEKVMLTYEHSEHDRELSVEEAMSMVRELGGTVRHRHFSGSVLRTVLARLLLAAERLNRSRDVWRAVIALDQTFVRIFCRQPNRLGPNAIFMIVRK